MVMSFRMWNSVVVSRCPPAQQLPALFAKNEQQQVLITHKRQQKKESTMRFSKAAALLSTLLVSASSGRHSAAAFVSGQHRTFSRTPSLLQAETQKLPILCDEDVMSQKAHGTSDKPVMKDLLWGCDYDTADRICNFNRHYAEFAGYWQTTDFLKYIAEKQKSGDTEPTKFYDSVTGKHLFTAPVGRSLEDFLKESQSHGWPSFRDEEVVWDDVRCLKNGECVSTSGTHLGHNIPDGKGNRYCINLVSVAGKPTEEE